MFLCKAALYQAREPTVASQKIADNYFKKEDLKVL